VVRAFLIWAGIGLSTWGLAGCGMVDTIEQPEFSSNDHAKAILAGKTFINKEYYNNGDEWSTTGQWYTFDDQARVVAMNSSKWSSDGFYSFSDMTDCEMDVTLTGFDDPIMEGRDLQCVSTNVSTTLEGTTLTLEFWGDLDIDLGFPWNLFTRLDHISTVTVNTIDTDEKIFSFDKFSCMAVGVLSGIETPAYGYSY
jgi:hypothetical protein